MLTLTTLNRRPPTLASGAVIDVSVWGCSDVCIPVSTGYCNSPASGALKARNAVFIGGQASGRKLLEDICRKNRLMTAKWVLILACPVMLKPA